MFCAPVFLSNTLILFLPSFVIPIKCLKNLICAASKRCLIIIIIITAACEQLAPTEYVKGHDGLAKIIHQKLTEAAELINDKTPYYKYTPANVLENEHFKLYWNRSTLTDKTIPFNGHDITFMNKKTKNTFPIHIAVPNIHNIAKTITDKQNKYQELANEICAVWKQKAALCNISNDMYVFVSSVIFTFNCLKLRLYNL